MFVGLLLAGLIAGCNGRADAVEQRQYVSPSETLTLAQLIAALNERAGQIPSLYLQGVGDMGGFEARLREGREQPARFLNGEIRAMYLAPDRLRLLGGKDLAGTVFDLGSDGVQFWMHLPTEKQLYYGTFAGLDPENARQLPIRPDLMLEVLGVAPMSTDFTSAPVPTLRYNPDSDSYMLLWSEPSAQPPERWVVVKEVWYDRKTLLPTLVILFDEHGDPLLRAYLSRHHPVGGEGGPMMASYYDLYFPVTGSTMWLDFGQMDFRSNRGFTQASFTPPRQDAAPDARNLDRPGRQ